MRRVINSTYISLDGVVHEPQNWTFGYRSEDAAQHAHDLLFGADAIIMGGGPTRSSPTPGRR